MFELKKITSGFILFSACKGTIFFLIQNVIINFMATARKFSQSKICQMATIYTYRLGV
jgi:hypothetical protein